MMKTMSGAVLAAAVGLIAGCAQAQPMGPPGWEPPHGPASSRDGGPPPGAPFGSGEGTYVSLGSSYAAGPGVGLPDPSSGACGRSLSNYAHLAAGRLHLHLVDVGCSGATTHDILDRSQHGMAPQIEAVDGRARLVTITIGGNDVAYIPNLVGYSCRDAGGEACRMVPDDVVDRRFSRLPDALRQVVGEVRRRAPRARIILIGYMPAVPDHAPEACEGVPLTPPDLHRIQDVYDRLAQVEGEVSAEMGIDYIRGFDVGAGHDACSPDPYVAGYSPARNPAWKAPVPYHPNQAGMARIAAAIEAASRRGE